MEQNKDYILDGLQEQGVKPEEIDNELNGAELLDTTIMEKTNGTKNNRRT
ncbi:MAG: hypothetical protein LUE27_06685 [Clostridia bacterium]|nr:hypothetical protein [Clostridia bacterium]